jgi:hypothetical protein
MGGGIEFVSLPTVYIVSIADDNKVRGRLDQAIDVDEGWYPQYTPRKASSMLIPKKLDFTTFPVGGAGKVNGMAVPARAGVAMAAAIASGARRARDMFRQVEGRERTD